MGFDSINTGEVLDVVNVAVDVVFGCVNTLKIEFASCATSDAPHVIDWCARQNVIDFDRVYESDNPTFALFANF
jgi:hypothetical protein